jgi:hypothetical protein
MKHQLVYISAATEPFSAQGLMEVMTVARKNNHRLGIGGLLVHHSGSFLQVLEGPEEAVELLFRRIEADPRHRRLVVLSRQRVSQPAFSDWSMGLVDRSPAELAAMTGLRDFTGDWFHLAELENAKTRAFYLLEAFSVGRLRQFVAA